MDCIVHRVAKSWTQLSGLIEPLDFSFFSISGRGIDLDYCDIEWFALETDRDHSVIFEVASKYCILDSFLTMRAMPFLLRNSCPQTFKYKKK